MRIFLDGCGNHPVIKRLIPEWLALNVGCSKKPEGCDVQLSLIAIKNKHADLPVVLRLDGIYYDKATDYEGRNQRISDSHTVADAVIYQSEFCKKMCERYLAPRMPFALHKVIYNGMKRDWAGPHIEDKYFNIVVLANWRRHKRLPEIESVFWSYCSLNDNARLHVFGNTLDHVKDTHPFITYYGHCTEEQMASVFQKADASLHLSKKDCCPNSVVEAITAGVPVITTAACGGAVELCNIACGCHVVEEKDVPDPCYHYEDEYNRLHLATQYKLISILGALGDSANICAAVDHPKELTIEYMAREYLKVLREVQYGL